MEITFFIVDNDQQKKVIEELYGKPELTYMVWDSPHPGLQSFY